MYAAAIDGARHTFQVSGSLWRDALVMQDLETKSLWSQISGECIKGQLEGARLELFPSIHTTYAGFRRLYPQGRLLKKPERGSRGSAYGDYFADTTKLGILGRADRFTRLDAKALVYGLRLPDQEVAIARDYLLEHGSAVVETEAMTVWVAFDSTKQTVTAEGMRWDEVSWDTGKVKAEVDDLAVAQHGFMGKEINMEPVPIITAYWFAWASFFPETELVK